LCTHIVNSPEKLLAIIDQIVTGQTCVRVLFDRASDVDGRYLTLAWEAKRRGGIVINDPEAAHWALDKSRVLEALRQQGIDVPRMVVMPAYDLAESPCLDQATTAAGIAFDFAQDKPFVVKPARGGGGEGVHVGVCSLAAALDFRREFRAEPYLLQEQINPARLTAGQAWFRTFWIGSMERWAIIPALWDTATHRYDLPGENEPLTHDQLSHIATTIHRVTGLTFFTFEAAITPDSRYVVIDPNNDQPDLRTEHYPDGLPEPIRQAVIRELARYCQFIAR
jgi:hypothetical protein